MVEIVVVQRTTDMHETYVGGTAGIDGTVIDWTKCSRDRIERIIEDGAGSIVVREYFESCRIAPLVAKTRRPLCDENSCVGVHTTARRVKRDRLQWAEKRVLGGVLIAQERVDMFGGGRIGTDDRVGLNGFAFVFDGLEGFRNEHRVVGLGEDLKTIFESGRSDDGHDDVYVKAREGVHEDRATRRHHLNTNR